MDFSTFESVARNIPAIPRWSDQEVEKFLGEFARDATSKTQIYDALYVLEQSRPRVFRKIRLYFLRYFAASPEQRSAFEKGLSEARSRSARP